MEPVNTTSGTRPFGELGSPADQLLRLQNLEQLLQTLARSLRDADLATQLNTSAEVSRIASHLSDCAASLPFDPFQQAQRQQLLIEIARNRNFCTSMLRRLRRLLFLRRHLLCNDGEPQPYTLTGLPGREA